MTGLVAILLIAVAVGLVGAACSLLVRYAEKFFLDVSPPRRDPITDPVKTLDFSRFL